MAMRLLQHLEQHAATAGGRVAYREVGAGRREISYARLRDGAAGFAATLRERVGPGAVVMICLPNRIEYPVAFLGALGAGCGVFPVSAETPDAELASLARAAGVKAIVGSDRALAALRDVVGASFDVADVVADETGTSLSSAGGDLLLCSSGTTGRPKIVVRDAASLDAVSANMVKGVGFRGDDQVLSVVPLCHSYGLEHGLLAPVWAGSTVHLCAGLDLGLVMEELANGGITIFPSVPSVFDMMGQIGEARRLPALRKAYGAGAPLPPAVAEAFEAKFDVRIGQLYGLTEVGSVMYSDPAGAHFNPRSVGVAFDGVRVRIAGDGEEGEVLISAPSMFRGYLKEPESGVVDGYFPTGDLGRVDEFGNLSITGRLKLLIDVGGLKVNVLEVEDALAQHPSVGEAAVVAMRVNDTVSRLKAVVTPRNAGLPPEPDELRRFLRERLTAYKVPRVIEVRESLPRSAAGKILRSRLEGS